MDSTLAQTSIKQASIANSAIVLTKRQDKAFSEAKYEGNT